MEIELQGCSIVSCGVHTETEWPILEGICNHLGANLEDMVIHFSSCDGIVNENMWIDRFAEEKMRKGINICRFCRAGHGFHFWAATSDTGIINLIRRIVAGDYLQVWIYGLPGLHIPNVLETLSNLTEGDFELRTHTKLKRMGTMDCLKCCRLLDLMNKEPIEEEEVLTMNAILGHIATNPSRMYLIKLPKVNL